MHSIEFKLKKGYNSGREYVAIFKDDYQILRSPYINNFRKLSTKLWLLIIYMTINEHQEPNYIHLIQWYLRKF